MAGPRGGRAGRRTNREGKTTVSAAGANPTKGIQMDAPLARWATPGNIVIAILTLLGIIALFHQWFGFQHRFSWGSDDWAHAYVVPFISGYAIWRERERLAKLTPTLYWPGLLPLALGIVCYFFFMLGFPNHMGQGFAIVLSLFGLALLNLGPRMTALLTFPIGYLIFAVTISERVMQGVTFQLQLIASKGSYILLNVLQIQTELAGNTLTIFKSADETIPLNVAEACSGMRMVIAFYALGAAVAFLSTRHWWQRIALLLLAGPIAIFVNVLRVASLGILSLWDEEFSKGNAHMAVGLAWLVPAFLLLMFCVWALKRMVVEPTPEDAS